MLFIKFSQGTHHPLCEIEEEHISISKLKLSVPPLDISMLNWSPGTAEAASPVTWEIDRVGMLNTGNVKTAEVTNLKVRWQRVQGMTLVKGAK